MKSRKIIDVGVFMRSFLMEGKWDDWYLIEGETKTFCKITLEGQANRNWFTDGEKEQGQDYILWGTVRPIIVQILKGNRLPTEFSFVLRKNPPGEPKGFLWNIRYRNPELQIVTACANTTFSMERNEEMEWDLQGDEILRENGFAFEVL